MQIDFRKEIKLGDEKLIKNVNLLGKLHHYWPGSKPADDLCRDRKVSEDEKLYINLLCLTVFLKEYEEKELLLAGFKLLKDELS